MQGVSSTTPSSVSIPTPNPASPHEIVTQLDAAMTEFVEVRGIQSAFNEFMVHGEDVYTDLCLSTQQRVLKIFKDCAPMPEMVEIGVKHVVSIAGNQTNDEAIEVVINILEKLVSNGVITPRLGCDALLESDKMVPKNAQFWTHSLLLIRKIIGGVDYKGVREVMKICMDKLSVFSQQVPPSELPQLNSVVSLLEHIFDRNNCLLPAYFVINEVLKNYPENRNYPHWSTSRLISELVDSFKPVAQLVSIIGRSRMLPVVEHSSHAGYLIMPWKLDPGTLRFVLKGHLPYDKELFKPQDRLLRYILEQPYSRDMACSILGIQKQQKLRCVALEHKLVELIVSTMEKTEAEMSQLEFDDDLPSTMPLWQHLSTQLIFFVLFQFASFPHIVTGLYANIVDMKLFKARDFLMWILLQFISGSIQKNPLSDFLPVLQLYDALYPEKEPLPVPDTAKPIATAQMSATCIWIHILKKAQGDNKVLPRPLPPTLAKQYDFLQNLVQPTPTGPQSPLNTSDYRVCLLCNAYSTTQDYFSRPMAALVEAIHGSSTNASTPTTPLSVQCLDSLTVHTKMSIIHNIVTHIMKVAQSKSSQNLAPALIETYARLLVYMEIESLGIKGFIVQLLPAVYKSQAWGILHTLLEMFCYRLHHILPHYRIQLLGNLHTLAASSHTSSAQLHLCVEMTSLRLIAGFNNIDIQAQMSRPLGEVKALVSTESEELNRALVLALARSIHITGADGVATGSWFREILNAIMNNTPHNWSSHTLQWFPSILSEYFQQNQIPVENKQQLKTMVDEEYRNWNAMLSSEAELIEHFSLQSNPSLFLCVVYKMLMETERMHTVVFKVIERIGPRGLSSHLRKFCDYIICEPGSSMDRTVETIMDMVWKYNIMPFDRFILCMVLRTNEGNDAQVCCYLINRLMFQKPDFLNRVTEFVEENSPEHWKQSNWHEKHKNFHTKFPEIFMFEDQLQNQLPVFFGNVCLRFLPVLDILMHRFLELNSDTSIGNTLLRMGPLYKFHDRPITYLYNTFHYYESRLREKPLLKKRLVTTILNLTESSTLSPEYMNYAKTESDDTTWTPDLNYYATLIERFVEVIEGRKNMFPSVDWRYNEFPNPAAHILYATCVEILALPVLPQDAADGLLSVVMKARALMESKDSTIDNLESWINATGLILDSLPEVYWLVLHDRLATVVEKLKTWKHNYCPLTLFNFTTTHNGQLYNEYANLLALTHSLWHHMGTGHLQHIQILVTERLLPMVTTEIQFLFICHLVAPFLQRFNSEKPPMVRSLTVALYELLEKVDKSTEGPLVYRDVFCDLLYHIKYMFTGDIVKPDVESKIRCLRPDLQIRLRFITHLNIEDIPSSSAGGNGQNITSMGQETPMSH